MSDMLISLISSKLAIWDFFPENKIFHRMTEIVATSSCHWIFFIMVANLQTPLCQKF